jgi:hypothetical protein
MPDWLEPMAATLTQDRFSGREWLFERKFDGIRLLAYKRGDEVQLFSRNRLPQDLPALAKAIATLPVKDVILDGEVTWDGRSGYHVFDLLWLNGRSVTSLPLEERRPIRSCGYPGAYTAWPVRDRRTPLVELSGNRQATALQSTRHACKFSREDSLETSWTNRYHRVLCCWSEPSRMGATDHAWTVARGRSGCVCQRQSDRDGPRAGPAGTNGRRSRRPHLSHGRQQ